MISDRRNFFSKLFAPAAVALVSLPALAKESIYPSERNDDDSYVLMIPDIGCKHCGLILNTPFLPGADYTEAEHPVSICKNSGRKWKINLTPWKAERTK